MVSQCPVVVTQWSVTGDHSMVSQWWSLSGHPLLITQWWSVTGDWSLNDQSEVTQSSVSGNHSMVSHWWLITEGSLIVVVIQWTVSDDHSMITQLWSLNGQAVVIDHSMVRWSINGHQIVVTQWSPSDGQSLVCQWWSLNGQTAMFIHRSVMGYLQIINHAPETKFKLQKNVEFFLHFHSIFELVIVQPYICQCSKVEGGGCWLTPNEIGDIPTLSDYTKHAPKTKSKLPKSMDIFLIFELMIVHPYICSHFKFEGGGCWLTPKEIGDIPTLSDYTKHAPVQTPQKLWKN